MITRALRPGNDQHGFHQITITRTSDTA